MTSKVWLAAAVLAAAALIASACGGGGGEEKPKPSPAPTEETLDLSKDALGRAVTVPQNPQRIVALAPSVVEFLYAVGAKPIGRPSSADYPEDAKTIPSFGTSYQPNTEEIVAMKPDLIIADAVIHESMMDSLTKLGAPVYAIRAASFDEVVKTLRIIGAITGHKEEGEKQAKALKDQLATIQAKKPTTTGPSFLIIIGGGQGSLYAAKPSSYAASVIGLVGGRNVIPASEQENFRFRGFSDYSMERMIQADPDMIFAISPGPVKLSETLSKDPVWSALKAVKNKRIYELDPFVYLQNPGPRVAKMLDELPGILYPDVFKASR